MSPAAMFRNNPYFAREKAREDFIATVAVTLKNWDERDRATRWCDWHWRNSDRKYRRRIRASEETAVFEFPDIDEAMEFHLRFGAKARNC